MSKQVQEDEEVEDDVADRHQSDQDEDNNQIMKENQSGMSTPPMARQKEMRRQNQLGMYTDPSDVIEQSSRKVTPAKSQSPKLLNIETRSVAEKVEEFFKDMTIKVKEAEDATDRWRKERNTMEYIKSPTNAPKPLAKDGMFF